MAKQIDVRLLAKLVEETLRAGLISEEQAGEWANVVRATAEKFPTNKALAALSDAVEAEADQSELREEAQEDEIRDAYAELVDEKGFSRDDAISKLAADYEIDTGRISNIVGA